jgi:LDH2 family malate/lactate/ureidoglycolate dehydrogenase
LLPFGGYKGFGLALMMQALGLLAGSSSDAESEYGYLFVAFRPDLIGSADAFEQQVTHLIERASRRRHGGPASTTSDRPGGIRCARRTARAVRRVLGQHIF